MVQQPWHFWLIGFGLTLVIEAPFALWLLASGERRLGRRVALFVLANLATHPLVWFYFPLLHWPWWRYTALSELWAFGGEVLIYWFFASRLSLRSAILASFFANGTSFGLGLLLVKFWGNWLFQY